MPLAPTALLLLSVALTVAVRGSPAEVPLQHPSRHCPPGWTHYTPTDECYRFWGSEGWNSTNVIRRTYDEAAEVCSRFDAELPLLHNTSHMDFLFDHLVGRGTGRQVWLQIREDPSSRSPVQLWRTTRGREFTEYFGWDGRRSMPGPESCAGLQASGDRRKRIVGGNNRMITLDCFERIGVLCAKQRVPIQVGAVNDTIVSGPVDIIYQNYLHVTFFGSRIPEGTYVSLQTTTEDYFATAPPHNPTHCRMPLRPLVGDAQPLRLNVTRMARWSSNCNGTCDMAHMVIPESLPLVRGAKYSFCFFTPIPFTTFKSEREFGQELLPHAYLEVIQPRDEYLRDVCERHQHIVEGFMINGHDDTHRPLERPFYFNSRPQGPEQGMAGGLA